MARQKNLSHIWLGKKILAINGSAKKALRRQRPRESIRWGPYCMQFWGDKSEIRAAGGLRKGEKRSVKKS